MDLETIERMCRTTMAAGDKLNRIQLWRWLKAADFTITSDGKVLAYKGVTEDNMSIRAGREPVTVNGTVHVGRIPYPVGAVVTIPRDLVDPDRHALCSVGLHVGTWEYASDFGQGRVLTVLVDPADFASVPADHHDQKARVCKLEVLDLAHSPWGSEWYHDFCDECDDCGEGY